MKKILCLVMLLNLILCSCGSKNKTNEIKPNKKSVDISEILRDTNGNEINKFNLDYAVGWNFDINDTVNIKKGNILYGCTVNECHSTYKIMYSDNSYYDRKAHQDGNPYLIWNENQYEVSCKNNLNGIIKVFNNNISFFPFDEYNDNFMQVSARNEENLEYCRGLRVLELDGEKYMVQSTEISIISENEFEIKEKFPEYEAFSSEPLYYVGSIFFDKIIFSAKSSKENEDISTSEINGFIQSLDDIHTGTENPQTGK